MRVLPRIPYRLRIVGMVIAGILAFPTAAVLSVYVQGLLEGYYNIRIINDLPYQIEIRERCTDMMGEPASSAKLRGLDAFCTWYTGDDFANIAAPGKSIVAGGIHAEREFVLLDLAGYVHGCATAGKHQKLTHLLALQFVDCTADYHAVQ